jgi:hypothetical protein
LIYRARAEGAGSSGCAAEELGRSVQWKETIRPITRREGGVFMKNLLKIVIGSDWALQREQGGDQLCVTQVTRRKDK